MSTLSADSHPYIDGDEYLPALLGTLNNRISSSASQLFLRSYGVGINEWRVLSVLSNTPASTSMHIGETVSMHKTVVSRTVRSMEAKQLLTINECRGARVMTLTDAGQTMHDEIANIALRREALLLTGFSAKERSTLITFLRRLRGNLEMLEVDGSPS